MPFAITRIEESSRFKLLSVLIGSVATHDITMSADDIWHTAITCVEHFEMISSAVETGFIQSCDALIEVNGYPMRIFVPGQSVET
jgi:hypothetical protein